MSHSLSHAAGTSIRTVPGLARALACRVLTLHETVAQWAERSRERRALSGLSDHLLHDIGISRADAEREVTKPFWRP